MGGEFAQRREWNHDAGLDWDLLAQPEHRGVQQLLRDLNRVYRECPALYLGDCEPGGFSWLQADRREESVFAWLRGGQDAAPVLVVANFTPRVHHGYCIGVPQPGWYEECINTDAGDYGGSGQGNMGGAIAEPRPADGQPCSLRLTLPPLATLILVYRPGREGPGQEGPGRESPGHTGPA
jgi:1,4-alpha-glucan branching enzyme